MNDNIYLLLGPETGLKEAFIESQIKKLEGLLKSKIEVFKYFSFDSPIERILDTLLNGLLFAEGKAVIVLGIEAYKKSDLALLEKHCHQQIANNLLFLCSDETHLNLGQLERVIKSENRKIFWELLEHQKKEFIITFFTKTGFKITDVAIEFLIEMVENSTKDLKAVCEKIALFWSKEKEIDLPKLENYIYHSKEENVFTLFGVIAKKRFELALDIINKLLLSNEDDPVKILGGLIWQLQLALRFFSLIKENYAPSQAFEKIGIKSKRQQKMFLTLKENYSLESILKAASLLYDYDLFIRTYPPRLHKLLLERLIYSINKLN